MSDHPREAARGLKRIFICDDVWYGIFALSERAILGLKLAPMCARFDWLVDRHLRTIRWTLGNIKFCCATNDNRAELLKYGQVDSGVPLEKSALLDVQPPPNLVGFKQIRIEYVDQNVIAFLHRITHLINGEDNKLMLPFYQPRKDLRMILTHLWPIMAPKLHQLFNITNTNLVQLRTLVSSTVLRDCANLRVIRAWRIFPEMPADDRADASVGQAIAMWLHTSRTDGRPKVLQCRELSENIATKLEGLKMTFVSAESPVSYIICVAVFFNLLNQHFGGEPFECENERTRERMTLQQIGVGPFQNCQYWMLRRGPIWWDKSQCAESELQAKMPSFTNFSKETNLISIENISCVNDDD